MSCAVYLIAASNAITIPQAAAFPLLTGSAKIIAGVTASGRLPEPDAG